MADNSLFIRQLVVLRIYLWRSVLLRLLHAL